MLGSIFFSAKPLVEDPLGLRTALAKDHWSSPATTPRLAVAPALAGTELEPVVTRDGRKLTVALPAGAHVRAIAVYAGGAIVRLVPAADAPATTSIDLLEEGRFAISVIDRFGRESAGIVVDVP